MKKVKLFKNRDQEIQLMERYIKQQQVHGSPLRILEAGCGRRWPLNLSGIQYTLTGVDINKSALKFRKTGTKDLDEAIIGDLHSVNIDKNKYDVIYNSFVLEHIQNAKQILNNFSKWLKPGGILIIRIPDRNSVYGFVTRTTPFRFHVFYKKYILRSRTTGKSAFGPYPTFHEYVVSRKGIHDYCKKNHLAIKEEYGQPYYLNGQSVVSLLTRIFVITVAFMSFGKLKWEYNNLTYIIEKNMKSPT